MNSPAARLRAGSEAEEIPICRRDVQHSIRGDHAVKHGWRVKRVVTNIDFDAWGEYLGDPPLAMAFLDRLVDGAQIVKFRGQSYRAHRAQKPSGDK